MGELVNGEPERTSECKSKREIGLPISLFKKSL